MANDTNRELCLRRDILSWLLKHPEKKYFVEDNEIPDLARDFFRELDWKIPDTIANTIASSNVVRCLNDTLQVQDTRSNKLDEQLYLDTVQSMLDDVKRMTRNESLNDERRNAYKTKIVDRQWSLAECWVRSLGLEYTLSVVNGVRDYMAEQFASEETAFKKEEEELAAMSIDLQKKFDDARKITIVEKIAGTNKKNVDSYISDLQAYVDLSVIHIIKLWVHDLLKDFCWDETNDELSKLKRHIISFRNTADELYKKCQTSLSEYNSGEGVAADSGKEAELPERKDVLKFIDSNIYLTANEQIQNAIREGKYIGYTLQYNHKTKKHEKIEEVRFFCNPNLERDAEKVIEDFLNLVISLFEKRMHESKAVQDDWNNKKVFAFLVGRTDIDKIIEVLNN